MDAGELADASLTLTWVVQRLAAMPDKRQDALMAALLCLCAQRVLLTLAIGLDDGTDPYDALCRAATDDIALPIPTRAEILQCIGAALHGGAVDPTALALALSDPA